MRYEFFEIADRRSRIFSFGSHTQLKTDESLVNEALITHFSCQNYLSIVEVTDAVGHRDQSGRRSSSIDCTVEIAITVTNTNGTEVAHALLEIVRFQTSNIKFKVK